MKSLINKYLEDKSLVWSKTTYKSESARLKYLKPHIEKSSEQIWKVLQDNKKPYSRLTYWTRLVNLFDWAIDHGHINGPNVHRVFKSKNPQLFRKVYEKKHPRQNFENVKKMLESLDDAQLRNKALQLLVSGMRYTESLSLKDDKVIGKGNKVRRIYNAVPVKYTMSYSTLWRRLRKLGLKPHDLRKLAGSKFLELGLNEFDLLKVMGWSSIETAKSYIAPKRSKEISNVLKEITNENI